VVDPEGVAGYFRYQYVPAPRTIYKDVCKLEPGHLLEVGVRTGQASLRPYWQLRVRIEDRGEAECLEALNAELDEAARLYVRSDVPFGAFLSGGVDSSLVTALMSRQLREPVRTFSIGFFEREHSELPFAAEVSRTLKTDHYEKVVSPQLASDILRKIVVHFGEPFADSSAVPTYYVAREAASQVKMVLSGDGGDEIFGGYWSYETALRDAMKGPRAVRRALLGGLARCGVPAKLRRWAAFEAMDPLQKHRAQRELFDDRELAALLAPGASAARTDAPIEGADLERDPVTFFQAQDVRTYMVDDVLTKVDRMSMASSLEVRVPLLDHKIVEMAFTLPRSLKVRWDEQAGRVRTKYLLKKSAGRFFPESFLERPKMGFGIPIVRWCTGPLRPSIEEGLRDPRNPVFEWVCFGAVQRMLDAFFRGGDLLVAKVWAAWMFDLWMKEVHLAA
jgi:asparagine synthase (glutamine-hydrolysing)